MSKRVANTRATTARNGRVRIGWRKRQALSLPEQQEQQLRMGKLTEQAEAALKAFRANVRKLVPKRFFRQVQGR